MLLSVIQSNPQSVLPVLQTILAICNIVIIGYGFMKFINKPHSTMEAKHDELKKRVDEHDLRFKEVEDSLHRGNDRFRKQEDINEVFINCMLAFIDFEMAYCSHTGYTDTEDLDAAKDTLRKYLARK